MKPPLSRVIQVTYEGEPDPTDPWSKERTHIAAVVLYPIEVKRRLATVDTANARAVKLAKAIIECDCCRPPNPDALSRIAAVTQFDLRPFLQPP